MTLTKIAKDVQRRMGSESVRIKADETGRKIIIQQWNGSEDKFIVRFAQFAPTGYEYRLGEYGEISPTRPDGAFGSNLRDAITHTTRKTEA